MRLNELTISQLRNGFRERQFSPTEVVADCIRQIEQWESDVQSWAWFQPESLLAQARMLEQQGFPAIAEMGDWRGRCDRPFLHTSLWRSSLWGIPVGIKDIMETAGIPTEMGSAVYQGHVPEQSAEVVQRLTQAGAVMAGKTVTTEFAYLNPGKTRNPWNGAHTPGGSSSGSAAAVAARFIPAALGTQTQGSVIRPAAFCGVIGYKPSAGLISLRGIQPLSPSLDQVGVFARCVDDVALMASVLIELENCDGTAAIARNITNSQVPSISHAAAQAKWRQNVKLDESWDDQSLGSVEARLRRYAPRLALVKTGIWEQAESEQRSHLIQQAKAFERQGAVVDEIDLPEEFNLFPTVIQHLMLPEVTHQYWALRQTQTDLLSARFIQKVDEGRQIAAVDYLHAIAMRRGYQRQIAAVFHRYDAVLTLATPGEAPKSLDSTGSPAFCELWSLLGVPAIALPTGWGSQGLPVGVQLVGGYLQDARLLETARWCEQSVRLEMFANPAPSSLRGTPLETTPF